MNDPVFDAVLALHILAAVTGFGAIGATGAYAAAARRSTAPSASPALRRYFAPGPNWGARAVLVVPLLGGTLLGLGHGADIGFAYPWIGLGLWFVATAVASAFIWPGERAIQRLIAGGEITGAQITGAGAGTGTAVSRPEALWSVCRRVERAAAVTSLCFVAALVVMVAQPR